MKLDQHKTATSMSDVALKTCAVKSLASEHVVSLQTINTNMTNK